MRSVFPEFGRVLFDVDVGECDVGLERPADYSIFVSTQGGDVEVKLARVSSGGRGKSSFLPVKPHPRGDCRPRQAGRLLRLQVVDDFPLGVKHGRELSRDGVRVVEAVLGWEEAFDFGFDGGLDQRLLEVNGAEPDR